LRDCYTSSRRLFAGRPDVLTRGRYWFAAPGTPRLEGPHCFGSTYFVRGEVDDVPIGEQIPKGYNFCNGDGPLPAPFPTKCGPASYFVNGDPGPGVVTEGPWGIIPCCYVRPLPTFPTRLRDLQPNDPAVQYWLAALARASYESDSTNIVQLATIVLGPPDSVVFVPNPTLNPIPGFAILRYPNFSVVVVSGTTTPEQWIWQIMQIPQGPTDFGPYGTIPLWHQSAVAVMTALAISGVPGDQPILLVGHSFGGTVATQVAATYVAANPAREVTLFTMGMPRPGDQRLADLTERTRATHLQNYGDPIPALPPTDFWISVFFGYAGSLGWFGWQQFRLGGQIRQLNPDGTTTPVDVTTALMPQMLAILASVIVIGPPPTFLLHTSKAYYDRLALQASAGAAYPIGPAQVTAIAGVYPP